MSAFWEWGYPDLPTCGPGHGPPRQPNTAWRDSTQDKALARTLASQGRQHIGQQGMGLLKPPPKQRRSRCRTRPQESKMTQGRTGRRQRAKRCSFPFGAKGAGTYTGSQSIPQRFPFWCNKTMTMGPAGWMSSPSPPLHHAQKLCRRRPLSVRIRCTSCPLSKSVIVGSLPACAIREEDQGPL